MQSHVCGLSFSQVYFSKVGNEHIVFLCWYFCSQQWDLAVLLTCNVLTLLPVILVCVV